MKTPALLLAATLALWGHTSGHWVVAALLAAGILLPIILKLRFDLEDRELNRAADLSSLLSGTAFIYFLATIPTAQALFSTVRWLPVCLYPVLLSALLSRQTLRRRHLLYTLRRSTRPAAQREIEITPLYFAATLLAASTAGNTSIWFFPCLALLSLAWLFVDLPGPRLRRLMAFMALFIPASFLGFIGAGSLQQTQQLLQDWYVEQLDDSNDDPYRSQTRIGDLGNLKLSEGIVWRVSMAPSTPLPLRLRDGVFTYFDGQAWSARRDGFKPFSTRSGNDGPKLEIIGKSRKQQALLALPQDTRHIEGLPATIEQNRQGIIRLKDAPDWLRFTVRYGNNPESETVPSVADRFVDHFHTALFARIPEIAALTKRSESDKLHGVETYFSGQFRYTLTLGKEAGQNRDLERFLLHDKAGHCEYFATATVLLLRHLGIPARYVTGYSLQEYSPLEKRFIARQRHAHAWAEAWIAGRWQDIDTTPSNWLMLEEQTAPWWQPVSDWLSWNWLRFAEWRQRDEVSDSGRNWLWLVMAIVSILLWRLWKRRSRQTPSCMPPGLPPDAIAKRLQALEHEFAALGHARPAHEPPRRWLQRMERECIIDIDRNRLLTARQVIEEHYRLRYSGNPDS